MKVVGAVGAGERVVAGAAVDGDVLEGGSRVLDADRIVAAARVDGDGRERGAVEARDELAVDDHVERRWIGRQHERVAGPVAGDLEGAGLDAGRVVGARLVGRETERRNEAGAREGGQGERAPGRRIGMS